MFAARRVDEGKSARESDDDDWLRVGRSFKSAAPAADVSERALQVYSKPTKRSRDKYSDSDSDSSDRASRRKYKKKKKKKHEKPSHRRESKYSSSSSDAEERRAAKRKRRRDDRGSKRSDEVARYRQRETSDELTLVEAPATGAIEVYSRTPTTDGREKLFEFDCAGDRENIVYGTLYTHEQPLYRLATRRSVVDGAWIVGRRNQHQPRTQEEQRDTDRYFGRNAKAMEKRTGTRRLHLAYSQRRQAQRERSVDGASKAAEMAFIPLDVIVEGELDGVLVEDTDGKAEEAPTDSASASMLWQTDQENIERFLVARQKSLNERVTATPNDVEAWLDVIAFQDEMRRLSRPTRGSDHSNEDASTLEKQQTILAKAIEQNPNASVLRLLQLNLLWRQQQTNTARANTTESYDTLVEKLLEKDRVSVDLWAKLIQSTQQKFGSFSMTMLRDQYARVVTVLNKALLEYLQSAKPVSTTARDGAFVYVVGQNSLLGKADPFRSDILDDEAWRLTQSLMSFHQSMLRAELAAGFTERAVALAQALLEFNGIGRSEFAPTTDTPHHELAVAFSTRWDKASSHVGEDIQVQPAYEMAQLPDGQSLNTYTKDSLDQLLWCCKASDAIYSSEHELDLVGPFGENAGDGDSHDDPTNRTTTEGTSSEKGGQWVYSNIHGQRIWIPDTDESKEYERILNELRGSEQSLDRQQEKERRALSKHEKMLGVRARLRDERADYAPVNRSEDEFTRWLEQESHSDLLQWKPLQTSNPEHADLIEAQPDRAILTEEMLPFVFRVPRVFHLCAVMSLLEGVGLRLRTPREDSTHLLSSDDFKQCSLFTAPVLEALDPSREGTIALSGRDRYYLTMKSVQQHVEVSELAAVDPSRLQFTRSVFIAALNHFRTECADTCRLLKVIWMEFEGEVVVRADTTEENAGRLRSFFQGLLSTSEEEAAGTVDTWLLSVYATVELRLNNTRQMNRICDKTIASLDLMNAASSRNLCRGFHRLVFTRVHQELSTSDDRLGLLRAFYLLWQVWAPQSSVTLDQLTKHYRKRPVELETLLNTHLEQHQCDVVGRYRIELQVTLEQCQSKKWADQLGSHFSCNVAYALSNLCCAIYAAHGFQAAKQEFERFLSEMPPGAASCHARKCWSVLFCFMQAHHVSGRLPLLSPREWRQTIACAVQTFPLEPLFLRLFVDAETSNTMSQSLRKHFQNRRQVWRRSLDSPELIEWLFALLCEFARAERSGRKFATDLSSSGGKFLTCCVLHRWGKNRPAVERIRRVFEEMVTQLKTSGAAIGWRLYLRFELAVGKVDAARKVFYRGLAKCPWSKALYLDGFHVLRPYISESECREISDFLAAKELHVRVDI